MRTKIEIDTRTFVRFWLTLFGIGLVALLLFKAQTALIILGVSFFLAMALNGPVTSIAKRLPGRSRVLATAIAYLMVIVVLGAIIFLVIPPIIQQSAKFAQRIPEVVESATHQWDGLREFVQQYNLQDQLDTALTSIQSSAEGWASDVGKQVVSGIGSFFSGVAAVILVLFLTFFMLIEGPTWMKRIWGMYKDKNRMEKHRRLASRMYGVVNGYVTGQLTVSALGATFAGLFVFGMSLIIPEIDAALAMPTAAITFILSLIPMFGATIGGTIVTLLLALNSIPAAIAYVVFFVVYQQIENNFISPHIQAKRNDLTALMILGSVTIGLYMFGIAGGIIAIPIAGSVRILIEEFLDSRRSKADITIDAPKVRLVAAKSDSKSKKA